MRNDLIKEEVMSQLLNTPNKNEETCVSHTDMEDISYSVPPSPPPSFEIPLHECDFNNRDNTEHPPPPAPLQEPISTSPMEDKTEPSPPPPTNEHSEIAADAQLEIEPPVKDHSVTETKTKNVNRSKSSQSQPKNIHRKNTSNESVGENRTISSMFDAMKRKLTPDKEADTTRNNQKVQRNDSESILNGTINAN